MTITYLPTAVDDTSTGNQPGTGVTIDVTDNDHDAIDPETVRLLDKNRNPVTTLTVPGEGDAACRIGAADAPSWWCDCAHHASEARDT